MKLYDAFISYGRADSKAFAIKLHEKLTAEGLNVWFDQEDIPLAVDYQEQINDGIEKAHNFLFIIAPHSVNSPYCLKEIELAIKLNKRIIPLLHVEKISRETWEQRNPNKTEEDWQEYQQKGLHSSYQNMHPIISKINWVYFREEMDDSYTAFTGLLNAISKHKDYVEEHTNLLARSLEWSRNKQQTNYLLVGSERQKAETWLKQRFTEELPPCLPTDLHCEYICESTKNAQNLLTQVFLSASDQDNVIKHNIRKTLMRESFTVWTNQTDIKTGIAFEEAIVQGLEGADNFVYLISSESLNSKYCQKEIDQALADNKRIIPLLIEKVDLELIPANLQKLQFIDFTEWENQEKYNISADKLLHELKQEPSYYEKHKILLVKARKWQRQNKNASLLLRGYNLQHFEAWLKVAKQRQDYPPLPLQEEYVTASSNQPTESSLEVFISYSRANSDFARKINDALQELGKTTWFDQESIATGTDFQQEIKRGIENSDNFLFIISPNSVNSPYCADEVEYAKKLNKRFVTILHQKLSDNEQKKLPPALANVQWLDFNQHGGEFQANFNELVRTLNTDREHIKNHTKWSQRALEWQEKSQSADLLLRGSEFAIAEEWLKTTEQEKKSPPATDLQKLFISQSREAIKAQQRKEKRQILVSSSLFIWASVALVAAIGGGTYAWRRSIESELNKAESLGRYSLLLFNEGKDLEASITAIKAGDILTKQKATKPEVFNALQTVLFNGRELNRLEGHTNSVTSISVSPNGKILASGSWDNTIKLWDVNTGNERRTLKGHTNSVTSVSFSPDGNTLASGSWDNTIKLWDVNTGHVKHTFKEHTEFVTSVSFSPDGNTLASGSLDNNNTIKLWDVKTGKEIRTSTPMKHRLVSGVSFSPDGNTLASGSLDNTIKLWNVKTGKEIRTSTPMKHNSSVTSVSFSPDGKILASGSWDNTIKLWNVKTGEVKHTLAGHDGTVTSVSFSRDGNTLASGSEDNTIKLWNVKTGKIIQTFKGHNSSVSSVSFSQVGQTQTLISGSHDSTIKLWNLEPGEKILTLSGNAHYFDKVSFSPDGKTLASGSEDNTIKLWDVNTSKEIRTFTGHTERVISVSFSPDGNFLASGSEDDTIKLWDVNTGQLKHTFTGHTERVISVSFSPDGNTLASGSADNTIKLWDVNTGKLKHTLGKHEELVYSVSFSPDGNTLASGSADNTIKLWDVNRRREIRPLKEHTNYVLSVTFSPDGQTLASGSQDKTIKLWDVKTGKEIRTLKKHYSPVNSVSFRPNSNTLASGSDDKTIIFWDIKTGEEIRTLEGHKGLVNSVVFSPDGNFLASASDEKEIKLWNLQHLNLDYLMKHSCDRVRNYLQNNTLKGNPDVSEEDRKLCDDWYSKVK